MSVRIYHRAVEDADIRALTRGRGSVWRNVLTVSLPGAVFVFAIVYWKWRNASTAAAIAGILLVASAVSNLRFFAKVRHRENLKKDPNAVEVWEISAERVLGLEHLGSNGPALCFFVGDGKAILLAGQWLNEYEEFPSGSFRLYRWSDTGAPIRIERTGPALRPEHSKVRLKPSYHFGKIQSFDAAPQTLQSDLDKALTKRPP